MAGVSADPNAPGIVRGTPDDKPVAQHDTYLVLSADERAKGFVRQVRRSYLHARELGGCGGVTTMGVALAETYARDPAFYGATYCYACQRHRRVGPTGEFVWEGTNDKVGT